MKRTYIGVLTAVTLAATFASNSAFGYYQDKFNPNSPSFDSRNTGYYSNSNRQRSFSYGGGDGQHVFRNRTYDFAESRPATGNSVFIYDPTQLSWAVYDADGQRLRTGPGSSGSDYCPDLGRQCHSPVGTFHIFAKEGPEYRSKIFPIPRGGAPMPYAMFFHGGFAVHGSYEVADYNASHGCVRITPADAEWLNHNVLNYGSTVIVKPYH